MKKGIHSTDYRPVVFEDIQTGFKLLTKSTAKTEETTKWDDGTSYPLVKVHISSSSHPFYTGDEKLIDIEGRVDKFKARAEAAAKAKATKVAKAEAVKKKPAPKKEAKKAEATQKIS